MTPTELNAPNLKYQLPETLEGAISIASTENPNVVSAQFVEKAANKNVRKVMGELLPDLGLEGILRKSEDISSRGSTSEEASIIATLTIPLYQQGSVMSRCGKLSKRPHNVVSSMRTTGGWR